LASGFCLRAASAAPLRVFRLQPARYCKLDPRLGYSFVLSLPEHLVRSIESLIFKENQKELNNLAMLQGRLQRHLECRTKEYEQLRTERETVQMIPAKSLWKP